MLLRWGCCCASMSDATASHSSVACGAVESGECEEREAEGAQGARRRVARMGGGFAGRVPGVSHDALAVIALGATTFFPLTSAEAHRRLLETLKDSVTFERDLRSRPDFHSRTQTSCVRATAQLPYARRHVLSVGDVLEPLRPRHGRRRFFT